MNRQDIARLDKITEQANALMNAPARLNPLVTNAQVVEALIGDIGRASSGRAPKWLAELIAIDETDTNR